MRIFCFGSINIDDIYRVPRIPAPGETLAASSVSRSLGGKGANTSVALARAGAEVYHIGSISNASQDDWVLRYLAEAGVDVCNIRRSSEPTGHAIVQVADDGENAITLFAGANGANDLSHIATSLEMAEQGDWFVLQNETNLCAQSAKLAKEMGLRVAYVAAPFDLAPLLEILGHADLIAMNEHEAAGLEKALGTTVEDGSLPDALVTLGERGAKFVAVGSAPVFRPALKVTEILDTTCAGDTYFGYFLSSYAKGAAVEIAMGIASAAASLTIQRPGASVSIPKLKAVQALL